MKAGGEEKGEARTKESNQDANLGTCCSTDIARGKNLILSQHKESTHKAVMASSQ